jgi:hypothetical protein
MARREVRDLEAVPLGVGRDRLEHSGVADVVLRPLGTVRGHDVRETVLRILVAEQAGEHRIGVETRETEPGVAAVPGDQACDGAVADGCEIETRHEALVRCWSRTLGVDAASLRPASGMSTPRALDPYTDRIVMRRATLNAAHGRGRFDNAGGFAPVPFLCYDP